MHLWQAIILICGSASIYMVASKSQAVRFWGCVIGLASQPAWLFVTWQSRQWGIFILTLFYTYSWLRGIRNNRSSNERQSHD